ncbi:MAG: toxin-antitoxin system YwqK family antitoxin, partial [Flavobacteriales bacterium]
VFVNYQSDGKNKREEHHYKANKKHGKSSWFYKDGTLSETCTYVDGKKEGEAQRYNSNGRLIGKAQFKDGAIVGDWQHFEANSEASKQ